MLLFQFLTRQPWIYVVFGCMLLGLIAYSVFDVKRGGNIVPFAELQAYSGQIIDVKQLGESSLPGEGGWHTSVYYEELSIRLVNGEKKQSRVLLNELLPIGAHVVLHEGEEGKVYNLLVDGHLLIDYQQMAAYALKRAEEAKASLTRPIVYEFAGLLIIGGAFAQIRRMRKIAQHKKQAQVSL